MPLLKDVMSTTFKKIAIITIVFVILTASTFIFYIIPRINETLLNERQQMLHEMSDFLIKVLYQLEEKEKMGTLQEGEAQEIALDTINNFRYGKNNDEYFWANHIEDGTMIAHPLEELLGDDLETYTDVDGYNFGKDMLTLARNNDEGYITYKWYSKVNQEEYVPKLSHVTVFEPWGWMLGTGMYIDDVQKEVSDIIQRVIGIFVLILALMIGLLIYIIRAGAKIEKQRNIIQLEFMSLIQHLPIGVFRVEIEKDGINKAPILWNNALDELLGLSDKKDSQQSNFMLNDFLKNKNDQNEIITILFKDGHIIGKEYELQTTDGKSLWIKLYGKLIKKNEKFYLDASVENITDKHKTQELLEKSYAELKKVDRMKNEIISITSHELRTPLTIIKGFASILSNENFGNLNDQQKKHVLKIEANTDKLLEMITNMLDLEKLEAGKMQFNIEEVELNNLIESVYNDFQIRCAIEKKNITFTPGVKSSLVQTDPTQIKRALVNLIDNALKSTRSNNGEVVIFTKEVDSDKIEIHVKDNGIGIATDDLEDIFEKFKQVGDHIKRISEGSGLGLPIVKKIIMQLGGTIAVKSELKKGSDFVITLHLKK